MQVTPNASIDALLEAIGENLKQRARQANIDQKDLAHLADIHRNTVSAALSGNDIRLSTLIRLTRVLSFSDWIMPFLEEPTPSPLERLFKTKKLYNIDKSQNKPLSRKLGRKREDLK